MHRVVKTFVAGTGEDLDHEIQSFLDLFPDHEVVSANLAIDSDHTAIRPLFALVILERPEPSFPRSESPFRAGTPVRAKFPEGEEPAAHAA